MENPQLVPGSMWANRKSGVVVSVLAVTNQHLSEQVQERHPPQVVFVLNGKMMTQTVDVFVKPRMFMDMDNGLAQAIEDLLAEEPEEEEIDIEGTPLPAEEEEGEEAVDDSNVEEDERPAPVFEPPMHDGLALDEHFVSYQEAPGPNGDTLHILRFALDETLNIDHIRSIFDFRDTTLPTLEEFVVDSEVDRVEVKPDGYLMTALEIDSGANGIAAVYLTTSGQFRLAAADVVTDVVEKDNVTQELHVIPQIQPAAATVVTVTPAA